MAILSILLYTAVVITSLLMILLVLIQQPKQDGLGPSFGGNTLANTFGNHTASILQRTTTLLAVIFFISAMGLAAVKAHQFSSVTPKNFIESLENPDPTGYGH